MRLYNKPTGFTTPWVPEDKVAKTLTTGQSYLTSIPRDLNEKELLSISTFPQDYDYPNIGRLRFLVGMSVPPLMTAQISWQMYLQWFKK